MGIHQETVRQFVRAAEYLEARPPIKPSKVSLFEGVCKGAIQGQVRFVSDLFMIAV
jgi:hypothetical protein